MPKSFRRTLGRHCSCALSESSELQCHFRQSVGTGRPCTLALCARPLLPGQSTARPLGRTQVSVAASIADAGSFCGGRATRGGQRSQHRLATPFCAAQRSLALRVASCMPAHTAAPSPWPGKHRACPLPPMGPRCPVLSKPPTRA